MSVRSLQRADAVLQASTGLRALTRETQRLADLTQIASRVLPGSIAPAVRAGYCRAGVLFLLAENAAVAAKVKQIAPRLLASYRRSGWQVTEIRVGVQVDGTAAPPPSRKPNLSIGAAKDLRQLANTISDPALRSAIGRLASRQDPSQAQVPTPKHQNEAPADEDGGPGSGPRKADRP
jgi:hypothetical protein